MLTTLLPLLLVFTVFLGPALGSFFGLQVVRRTGIFRHDYGANSECDKCGHKLAWYDLVPLVSFITLRGKCRYCAKPISHKLFFCELLGLILYATFAGGLYYSLATDGIPRDVFVSLVIHGSILTILLYFCVWDMLTMSVPAVETQLAAVYLVIVNVVFLIVRLINPSLLVQIQLGSLGNLLLGVLSGLFMYVIIRLTKSKGMGLGDLLIAVMIGLALGWPQTVSAFYVMIFTGSIFGLALAAVKHKFHGLQIPLVPFMTFGYIVALVFGTQIFHFLFGI